jgi:hypothetical protein
VPTDVAVRQDATVPGWLLGQFGGARVDLEQLVNLPVPAQPPPLVASARGGKEGGMSAIVSGHQLTTEVAALEAHIPYQNR